MEEILYLGSAYLTGLIANRLSFPPLVGYLVAGYLLHYFNEGTLQSLTHIADIGIELLLFSVGLKLRLSSLLRREVLAVGGSHILIVTGVSGGLFFWLGEHVTGALILGVSLAFSSTVLAIKVLEDNGEISSLHGRDVLSILIFQDIVAIALLALADNKAPTPWALALLGIPLLRPIAHLLLSLTNASELRLLLGVCLALAGGLFAETVSVSPEIGALLTGVMMAAHEKSEDTAHKLWGLKELFLVAFFLQIGLSELPGKAEIISALELLLVLPLQGVLFFILFLMSGLRARTAFVSSIALMTYSEFALITTDAMVKAGFLSAEWKSIISLAVAGSLAIAAQLNRFSHRLFALCESTLAPLERKSRTPDHLPVTIGKAEWLVLGMGQTGVAAYLSLHQENKPVIGLDADPIVLKKVIGKGLRVVYGDAEDAELWRQLPLDRVKGIVLTMPDYNARYSTIELLRNTGYLGQIGTICFNANEKLALEKRGASFVIHPLYEAGSQLAKQLIS